MTNAAGEAGAALYGARMAKNRTLRWVAERAGVTATYIWDMERGRRPVSRDMAAKIEQALELPAKTLSGLVCAHVYVCKYCQDEKIVRRTVRGGRDDQR